MLPIFPEISVILLISQFWSWNMCEKCGVPACMVASYNFQTSIYIRILKQKQKLFVLRSYIYIVVYPILLSSMVFPSVRHIVCLRNHILINLIEENCFSYYISVWFEFLFLFESPMGTYCIHKCACNIQLLSCV